MASSGLAYFVWMVLAALIALVLVVRMRRFRTAARAAVEISPSSVDGAGVVRAAGLAFVGIVSLALVPVLVGLIALAKRGATIAASAHAIVIVGLIALLMAAILFSARLLTVRRCAHADDDLFEEGGTDETDR